MLSPSTALQPPSLFSRVCENVAATLATGGPQATSHQISPTGAQATASSPLIGETLLQMQEVQPECKHNRY